MKDIMNSMELWATWHTWGHVLGNKALKLSNITYWYIDMVACFFFTAGTLLPSLILYFSSQFCYSCWCNKKLMEKNPCLFLLTKLSLETLLLCLSCHKNTSEEFRFWYLRIFSGQQYCFGIHLKGKEIKFSKSVSLPFLPLIQSKLNPASCFLETHILRARFR